jgi:hypothetical protein
MDEPVGVGRAERLDGITFDPPERRFAVLSEDRRDRPPIGAFDALVEIDEGCRMSIREPFSDDALATPGNPTRTMSIPST